MVPRSVLALLALSAGLAAQSVTRATRPLAPGSSPSECAGEPTVLEGSVSLADGTPVADAVVVSDAGGLAHTGVDGRFRLELALSPDLTEVRLTALLTTGSSTRSGRLAVAVRPGVTIPVGDLTLSSGCEPAWLPTFGHYEDLPQIPHAFATWDDGNGPSVYVGCGSTVFRWSGEDWEPLPGIFQGFGGGILSLVAFDDGQGSKLYAGGTFVLLDDAFARGLARWDGSAWEILQPNGGLAGMEVSSMEIYDDGLGGGPALVVAGDIELTVLGQPAHDFLRYDGSWSVLGSPPPGQRIVDLEVYDDGLGGGPELYASGTFDVGGTPTIDLARWNGTRWELLSAVFQGPGTQVPPVLRTFDDGLGGGPRLCAAGAFTTVNGVSAHRVAGWDGSAWTALGTGITFLSCDLTAFDNGNGPGLYACGTQGSRVERWDGTSWSTESLPLSTVIEVMEVVDDGSGATLWAGTYGKVVRWEGDHWAHPVRGLSDRVQSLVVHDDGLGGGPMLHAGGRFVTAGGRRVAGIARWDGAEWSPLGDGLSIANDYREVRALATYDDGLGGGPALIAAGVFATAGGVNARNIARWDGTSWSALAAGLNDEVSALAVYDDGLGGGPVLCAGGLFTASGATPLAHVARWDGVSWSPLGSGTDAEVRALAVHDDGLGGGPALYAGGSFTTADGFPASEIARWDGIVWSPLGSGLAGGAGNAVESLLSFDDGGGPTLWAGGSFQTAGGSPARTIARWDGLAWSALPATVSGTIRALAAFDDGTGGGPALYATGSVGVDGTSISRVARWDGASWSSLGVVSPVVGGYALAVADGGAGVPALILGGLFMEIGGTSDSNIARWQGCASVPPTLACPDRVEAGTFSAVGRIVEFEVSATGAGTPAPVVVCVPPSGSFFPLGTTIVHCTATDAMSNESTCDFPVHVFRKARRR